MRIDSRCCFHCDARLADPPVEGDGRLRYCPTCEADLEAVKRLWAADPHDIPSQRAFVGAVGLRVVPRP